MPRAVPSPRAVAVALALAGSILAGGRAFAQANLSGSPDPLDFGSERVNTTSSQKTVTVTNSGDQDATVAVSITGTNATDFALVGTPPTTIAAGASVDIPITFTPLATGPRAATLDVAYSPPASSDLQVALQGSAPALFVSPGSNTFADQRINTSSAATTFTVTNDTSGSRTISSITKTGSGCGAFVVTPSTSPPLTLASGTQTTFDVTFQPTATGSFSCSVDIASDDPNFPDTLVPVDGTGTEALISLSPASHDFLSVLIGQSSTSQTFTISNPGSATVTVSSVTLGGTDPGDFQIVSAPSTPFTIAAGGSQDVSVQAVPTAAGTRQATLDVTSDADSSPNPSAALSCTGVTPEPALAVSPNPVSFPDTRAGDTSSEITVTLSNNGSADLTVSLVTVSPASIFPVTTPPPATPFTIPAGQSQTFGISFAPTTGGSATGALTVDSNDPGGAQTVPLSGTGLVSGMTVTPSGSYDFGDVLVGGAGAQKLFTIQNTGEAAFSVASITLSNTQDFAIQDVSPSSYPATLQPGAGGNGDTATFRVVAKPTTLGQKKGTVTITTDIPGGQTTTFDVTANGIAPALTPSVSSIDFGAWDVQSPQPASRKFTVKNTGTAALKITDVKVTGMGAAVYGATTAPLPLTIQVGASADVTVTYAPTMESAAEPPANLVITSDAYGATTTKIPLSGHGIDRHIVASTLALDFPPTYRNPASPPVLDFKVSNTGQAPLAITAVMTGGPGASAFHVTKSPSMTIAGNSSDTVSVAFAPTAISGAPITADLVLVNDDSDQPMLRVALSGTAILPNIVLQPGVIDLGSTGVGVKTTIPLSASKIQIINMDAKTAFTIRDLRLVDGNGAAEPPGVFQVRGFKAPQKLAAAQSVSLDIAFDPPSPGEYTAYLDVYVDSDPVKLGYVKIVGKGVDVKLRGGGCGVAGDDGGGAGALLWVLLGAWVAMRRRRRCRCRSSRRTNIAGAAVVLLAASLVAWAPRAGADPTRDLDLSNFAPMPATEPQLITVETPMIGRKGQWALGLAVDHAVDPLVVEAANSSMTDSPITARTATSFAAAYAITHRYEVGGQISVLDESGDRPMFSGIQPPSGAALGNLALHAKARWLSAAPLSLGSAVTVTIPTATSGAFAGSGGPTLHLRGIAALAASKLQVVGNAGFRLRRSAALADIEQGDEITYGVGASYRVMPRLAAIGELFGAVGLGGGSSAGVTPLEAEVGVRYRLASAIDIVAGGGRGLLPGIGAPAARAFLMVSFSPGRRKVLPVGVTTVPDRGDDDHDGILNYRDRCPEQPEDVDGFQDSDGCPDLDNDKDGIPDSLDHCPNVAEDKDGFQDDDGCPDLDNDKDGIPDARDACPNEAEDKDGFQDSDGCPDVDNDHDGIPDVVDRCPNKPETINGNKDDDGCPDAGESLVMVMPDRIGVIEPVRFRRHSAHLLHKSERVLEQVAATLRAEREITLLEVRSYVNPGTPNAAALTQHRAEVVRKWLVHWGLAPERLQARGYGDKKPLLAPGKRGARKINDRVEFVILEKKLPKRRRARGHSR